jgi:peptidoglycan/xylan/chitin deacetylase (PgdA/CDA1 family)
MHPTTRAVLCAFYKYSGALFAEEMLARLRGRSFAAILLFHRVTDAVPPDGLTVGTARFRDVCRMLRRGFHVVPLAEVFRQTRSGRPLPRRTVAVTFDDCYRDNLGAARVLAEYGLPACFFLPTAYVGTERVFPWDAHLPRLDNLTWDDVREMAGLGFEIGSHSVNHPDMARIPLDEARRELVESKRTLEQRTGKTVRFFAYPFGGQEQFPTDRLPLVYEAGYEGCVSAHGGFVVPGSGDAILPREAVPYFRSALHLELFLSGGLQWVYALRRSLLTPQQSAYARPPEKVAAGS